MNFICEKQKLQEGISIVQKAITGKSTMPILEGIYIEANKEGINTYWIRYGCKYRNIKLKLMLLEEGSIVIDAKIFGEIIRKLPNSDVKIETIRK